MLIEKKKCQKDVWNSLKEIRGIFTGKGRELLAGREKRNPERMRELEDREPFERDLESSEVGWKRFCG